MTIDETIREVKAKIDRYLKEVTLLESIMDYLEDAKLNDEAKDQLKN